MVELHGRKILVNGRSVPVQEQAFFHWPPIKEPKLSRERERERKKRNTFPNEHVMRNWACAPCPYHQAGNEIKRGISF